MGISTGWKVAGGAALVIGTTIGLAACAGRGGGGSKADGPMADLTKELLGKLKPGSTGPLDVATQAVREVRRDNGTLQGTYDGTRLLAAADSHAYGTPTIGDPARDVKGDGTATFNEVRHVVQHFDTDGNLTFDFTEARAFEAAVGVRWIPGES